MQTTAKAAKMRETLDPLSLNALIENATVGAAANEKSEHLHNTTKTTDWEQPLLFSNSILPPFPLDVLPVRLQKYCYAVSENCQISVDIPAVSVLGILSASVQKKFVIVNNIGWKIPINIFLMFIAESADGKSPALNNLAFPFFEYECEYNERNKTAIDESKARIKFAHSMLAKATRTKNPSFENIKICEKDLREAEEAAVYPMQLIAQDFTVEALGEMLRKQGGKISVISSEGGFFTNIGGRYSEKDTKQIDAVLQSHNGIADHVLRFNRIGRGDFEITEPSMTIILGAQEIILRELMADEQLKRKGLHGRFFYSKPVSKVGNRSFRDIPQIPESLKNEYAAHIKSLLNIQGEQMELTLSDEATELLTQYYEWREPLLSDGEELSLIQSWAGKSDLACMRIAGILHLSENIIYTTPYKNDNPPITGETMQKAIRLVRDYFLPHAKSCFLEMSESPEISNARYLWKRVLSFSSLCFTKRELQRKTQGKEKFNFDESLKVLENRHLLRVERNAGEKGRPSEVVIVNPNL
jgi:hypothetical protein